MICVTNTINDPLPVFPCFPNKRPACEHGYKDASNDPDRIRELWAGRTGLLVAVPTGAASGISVLDVDVAGMPWLASAGLPATRQHQTRSGGRHLVYRHAAGLRCSQSVVAPGVDVRADGGYVIFWPMHGFAVDDRPLADWPQWLVKASAVVGNPVVSSFEARMPGFHTAHVAPTQNYWSRLNSVTARLSTTPPGSRGRTLNWAALVLGNMIAECGLGWYDAEARLIAACKQNGLWGFDGEREVRREIERGLSFGIRCWRDAVQSGIAACGGDG